MRHQNCSFCSSLNDYEKGFQKSGEGTFLPAAAEKLSVLYDLKPISFTLPGNPPFQIPSSRLLQLRQCPECETFYLYRTDYEFLWGGSEDEQILERLTDEQARECLEKTDPKLVTRTAPSQPGDSSAAGLKKRISNALEKNKSYTIRKLEQAAASGDRDDLDETFENLSDGTCDYLELIPILQRIAGTTFYYFDDNGAGGYPRPDVSRPISFEWAALKSIENIRENAGLASGSETARALKSNDPKLIKTTLERLKAEGTCDDRLLLPILTKIARKDVYQTYDDGAGHRTEYHLEDPARDVIKIIYRNYLRDENEEYCRLCEPLDDDLKIKTESGGRFPEAFEQLVSVDGTFNAPLRRCPACGIYFNWIELFVKKDTRVKTGEQLIRLSTKSSLILDSLFSTAPQTMFEPADVEDLIKALPLESLLPALRKHFVPDSQIIKPFIPQLLKNLERTDDPSIEELLIDYISNRADGAQEILAAFRAADGWGTSQLHNLLRWCLTVADNENYEQIR